MALRAAGRSVSIGLGQLRHWGSGQAVFEPALQRLQSGWPHDLPSRLALRQFAVAADVAVLAADDDVDGVLGVTEVLDLAHGRCVDPGEAAGLQLVARTV